MGSAHGSQCIIVLVLVDPAEHPPGTNSLVEDSLPSILENDGSIDYYSPITAKDYDPLNEPMSALPAELIPKSREEEKKHPKLVFGYALLRPQLLICARRMDVVPLEILQQGNYILPLMRISAALSKNYGRQLAACTPFADRRDADLLAELREDLGLPHDAQPLWWWMFANYDVQERLRPNLQSLRLREDQAEKRGKEGTKPKRKAGDKEKISREGAVVKKRRTPASGSGSVKAEPVAF
ncbi:hypothetical protein BDV98DRAFT_594173 [Pterulicium gracile]|uniref:Uncharacterized protein n=1 Tax=Pterulicium gracile TaxID=1884261 RepID=A0A5C3QFX4_9AGAR|nr:hypothetical protein BDV98DRAFT_594173 [Pterula gracilis]